MLGMDFTGGYSVALEVEAKNDDNYRGMVEEALIAAGATAQDVQVRALSPSNNIKILLGRSLDQMGRPLQTCPLKLISKMLHFNIRTIQDLYGSLMP